MVLLRMQNYVFILVYDVKATYVCYCFKELIEDVFGIILHDWKISELRGVIRLSAIAIAVLVFILPNGKKTEFTPFFIVCVSVCVV